ncbi:MAG: DUF1574 domain-containing protein [bacterium]|nr:DUF1574 domain-containing protein [bacterium]
MLFLLLLILAALNVLGTKAGRIYKDGASIICENKRQLVRSGFFKPDTDKKNILFMGTSRILAGIRPKLFDQLNGNTTLSYNLALPALPIGPYYFQLKDYLETTAPPRRIILELKIKSKRNLQLFHHYANQGISGPGEAFSYFRHCQNKSTVANYLFPIRMYKYFVGPYVVNSIFNPAALKERKRENHAHVRQMKTERGYFFIKEQALFPDLRLPENYGAAQGKILQKGEEFDPFTDPYVAKFFDLAAQHHIVIQIIQPVYRSSQFRQYETMPRQYCLLSAKYPEVLIRPGSWKAKFYENKYFADPVHLNPEGADRYTREIHKEFQASETGSQGPIENEKIN